MRKLSLLVSLAVALSAAPLRGAVDVPDDPAARGAIAESLRRHIEAASTGKFYLSLAPESGWLRLMLQGVVLQEYTPLAIELATGGTLFSRHAPPEGWADKIWTAGRLEPPRPEERLEIVVPPPDATEAPAPFVPPTTEERIPAPPSYFVRFADGLAIEVRSEGEAAGLGRRLREAFDTFRSKDQDTLRLRITLAAEDAAALYRSIPPDTSFLLARP